MTRQLVASLLFAAICCIDNEAAYRPWQPVAVSLVGIAYGWDQ